MIDTFRGLPVVSQVGYFLKCDFSSKLFIYAVKTNTEKPTVGSLTHERPSGLCSVGIVIPVESSLPALVV